MGTQKGFPMWAKNMLDANNIKLHHELLLPPITFVS